jgi:hypothetical protein
MRSCMIGVLIISAMDVLNGMVVPQTLLMLTLM